MEMNYFIHNHHFVPAFAGCDQKGIFTNHNNNFIQ